MTYSGHLHKQVLVTGGAGFLGSHLCEVLVEEGEDVLCLDNFYTGSRANIQHLLGKPNFELLRHDVTFPLYIEVDEVYNLACPASPIHYQHDPVQTTKTSVHGAINMLGLAKRTGAKILQASTSEVYGDPEEHPQPEHYWGMSIRSVRVPVTTRVNVAQKHCFLITIDSTIFRSRSPAYLIPMAQGCIPMMAAWCLISLCKP